MDTQTGLHPSTGCSSVVKSRERDGVMGRQVGNLQCILFNIKPIWKNGKAQDTNYQDIPEKANHEKGEKISA